MRERHRPYKIDKGSWFAGLTLLAVLASSACGTLEMRDLKDSFGSKTEGTENSDQNWASVRVGLTPSQVLTSKLTESDFPPDAFSLFAFDLVSATSMKFNVSGCASGYTVAATSVASYTTDVKLYNTDKNCVVGLMEFSYGGSTFFPPAGTTELSGSVGASAIFQTAGGGQELKVKVYKQLLAGGIANGQQAAFTFLKSVKGTDVNVANYSAAFTLKVEGVESPAFTISKIDLIDIASVGGAATFRFTLQCNENLVQVGSDWACPRVAGETDPQKVVQMAVKLIADTGNVNTYTYSQIETLMSSGTTTLNNSSQASVNTITTDLVGPGQLVNNKSMILIVSYTDPVVGANPSRGTSYAYFNVDIGNPL